MSATNLPQTSTHKGTIQKKCLWTTSAYLRVFEAKFRRQFLSVWFADVLLFLKHLFQCFALHVREDCPSKHSSPRLPSSRERPCESSGNGHCWRCYKRERNKLF